MSVRLERELKRSDIEPLMEPLVERSINKCKETLEKKRLSVGDIEKIILVGGPTLTPIFRDILSKKLNIPLESRMDPLTVNASGAAIFAGTQRMSKDIMQWRPVLAGQYRVELEYKPVGNESEPLVGGKVIAPKGGSLAGFTIEFVESKTRWQSGRISLGAKSTFVANVRAEKGRTNEFLIELRDATGNLRETAPDRFPYTIGMEIPNQPLINSVGVALFSGEMQIFLSKGTPLPARHRKIHRTVVPLKKGESGALLKIPVVEGEHIRRFDRNVRIGVLEIPADRIRRDVPAGSEVEITIIIDESRLVLTKAYVSILDEEFENVLKLGKTVADPKQLADDFKREQARLEEVRGKVRQTGTAQAEKPLQKIQGERMEHDIEVSLAAAQGDPDAADKCEKRLIDFKIAIDEAEDALQWPTLVSEAETEIQNTREIVNKYGKGDDRRNFDSLESEVRAATAAHDADVLRHKTDRMGSLKIGILVQQPGFWVGQFEFLSEEKKSHMRDQVLAERLIAQGRRAIETNDINALQAVVRQLIDLLPAAERQEVPQGAGGTMPI
jgi:molecular chaperone DnaK